MIYTGGQADLDTSGKVVNPDELEPQTRNVLLSVSAILADFDATLDDILKLVIYFTGDHNDEARILDLIASLLPEAVHPAVSTICLPQLCYPGMIIELEAVAVDTSHAQSTQPEYFRNDNLPLLHPHYSHVVRCNHLVMTSDLSAIDAAGRVHAPDDLIEQTRLMMDQLAVALNLAGAASRDVLKLNVFYEGDGTAENWETPARLRAEFFKEPGPAATGISVTAFAKPELKTKISVTAAVQQNNEGEIQYAWPENHWDWTTHLPYKHGNRFGNVIHLGGQVALDSSANVLHADDIVRQTKIALDNIAAVLAEFDATLDDIVKVTAFYQGGASAEDLHKNLLIRSSAFSTPGPATSGIPIPHLVYEHMMIEIEVIAIARTDQALVEEI